MEEIDNIKDLRLRLCCLIIFNARFRVLILGLFKFRRVSVNLVSYLIPPFKSIKESKVKVNSNYYDLQNNINNLYEI